MVSLKALCLYLATASVSVSAAPLIDRAIITTDILISDIGHIDSGYKSLTRTLKSYNGSIFDIAPIAANIAAIHVDEHKGFLDAELAPVANLNESSRIVAFASHSVGVDIPTFIRVLESKKENFSPDDRPKIADGLKKLKKDHDAFSVALAAKLEKEVLPKEKKVVAVIDGAFQSGIDYFSS
ncbi:hypothetical protein MFRU_026g00310 [Monilinia fructicola]|uniref:Uncharacterized protein n=1 Tax=Monilinia fructicola TaxID=38448 RepID=A0A5M9JRW0_MONFR|nr:hypothetical protein EYC84_001420 [Monilinia fructicola]KAG4027849.1 hypothetical protein MFRU_026g00310 [Monilinia fructicola]